MLSLFLSSTHTHTHNPIKWAFFRRKNKKAGGSEITAVRPELGNDVVVESSYTPTIPKHQATELGTINYVNLTSDGCHGEFEKAVQIARETGKPIFANFVEWRG